MTMPILHQQVGQVTAPPSRPDEAGRRPAAGLTLSSPRASFPPSPFIGHEYCAAKLLPRVGLRTRHAAAPRPTPAIDESLVSGHWSFGFRHSSFGPPLGPESFPGRIPCGILSAFDAHDDGNPPPAGRAGRPGAMPTALRGHAPPNESARPGILSGPHPLRNPFRIRHP